MDASIQNCSRQKYLLSPKVELSFKMHSAQYLHINSFLATMIEHRHAKCVLLIQRNDPETCPIRIYYSPSIREHFNLDFNFLTKQKISRTFSTELKAAIEHIKLGIYPTQCVFVGTVELIKYKY